MRRVRDWLYKGLNLHCCGNCKFYMIVIKDRYINVPPGGLKTIYNFRATIECTGRPLIDPIFPTSKCKAWRYNDWIKQGEKVQ